MKRLLAVVLSLGLCLCLFSAVVPAKAAAEEELIYQMFDGQVTVTTHDNTNFFHDIPPFTSNLKRKRAQKPTQSSCAQTVGNYILCFLVVLHISVSRKERHINYKKDFNTTKKSCQGRFCQCGSFLCFLYQNK